MHFLSKQPTWLTTLLSFLLLLAGWQALVSIGNYERFILPGPRAVLRQLGLVIANGRLARHTLITLSEVLPGLLLGFTIATPLGYLLAKSPLAERLLSPYLVASQAVPVIAIAPLLTIWVDSVYWNRVLVATLVVFFPILINVIAGMRSVPDELYELMASLRATRWQTFVWLELPAALPILLAGLKVGATLSVIGALVGEFIRTESQGLGYLLIESRQLFRTDRAFAILITLAALALLLYATVAILERHLLRWQREGK